LSMYCDRKNTTCSENRSGHLHRTWPA
jgi:hypothetical protein